MPNEILGTSKIYNGNIHIPVNVLEKLEAKDGQKLIWIMNDSGEIMISSSKMPSTYDSI